MNHQRKFIVILCLILLVVMTFMTACKGSMSSENEGSVADFPEAMATGADESTAGVSSVLDNLEITLPAGMERSRISDSQEFIKINNATIGGILLLECDEAIFADVLNYSDSLTPLVVQAMENMGVTDITWHMGETSLYGLQEYNLGNEESEYIAYVVRGYSACYVLWFDREQISYEKEIEIMQSVYSEDIADDLNKISSEAYMTAIGEKIDAGEYRFEVDLPENVTQGSTTDNSALFYLNNQVIGGYKIVHFEKGILPAVQENSDLIVERLKEYMLDQIDLSDFNGEITDEALITAVFTNGIDEHTLFILSYGQVGTQYVIWLDTAILDQATIDSIMWGARLVKNE